MPKSNVITEIPGGRLLHPDGRVTDLKGREVPEDEPKGETEGEAPKGNDTALSSETFQTLANAGLDTPEKLVAASDDELKAIPGIGAATIAKIRAAYPVVPVVA